MDPARLRARAGRALGHAWDLTRRSVEGLVRDRGAQLAASIAYYGLLSIFPAAIVLAAILGLIIGNREAQQEVVDFLLNNLPVTESQGRTDLEEVVRGVTASSGALGVVGTIALLISASGLMGAIRNSLNVVWGVDESRPPLRGKALDILFVLGIGVLLVLSVAVTLLGQVAVDLGDELGGAGGAIQSIIDAAGPLVPIAVSLALFTVLLRVVPSVHTPIRDIWPGVVVAALGYELAKGGFSLYLENFGRYNLIYGSLGAVIAFLVFIYVAALVLLLGGEFAAFWPRVREGEFDDEPGDPRPFGQQVLGFLKGLAVRSDEDRVHDDQAPPRRIGARLGRRSRPDAGDPEKEP